RRLTNSSSTTIDNTPSQDAIQVMILLVDPEQQQKVIVGSGQPHSSDLVLDPAAPGEKLLQYLYKGWGDRWKAVPCSADNVQGNTRDNVEQENTCLVTDLSQMALSRASFTTPMVDSNPRKCDRKDFPHKRRCHHPFRRCLDPPSE